MSVEVPLLCFNDVYRVSQKYVPQPNAPEYDRSKAGGSADKDDGDGPRISVSQFAQTLLSEREKWADSPKSGIDGKEADKDGRDGLQKEGLVLFAGDVFNPSTESSISRGSHMVSPGATARTPHEAFSESEGDIVLGDIVLIRRRSPFSTRSSWTALASVCSPRSVRRIGQRS